MRYLKGARILDLAVTLKIPRSVALEYMRSLSYHSALGYADAWGRFFTEKLGREVRVTFGNDNWHVSYRP